jgi:hypothetical protein
VDLRKPTQRENRSNGDELTKLYLHLMFAALKEKAAMTAAKEQPEYLSTELSGQRQPGTLLSFPK